MRLSIVSGTLNRLPYLQRMVESVRASCRDIEHEIIIVDGGSTDGTLDWLHGQPDIAGIEQGARLGAVRAFNAGFAVARGEYVANLNDDSLVIGDTLAQAVHYLDAHPKVGQVAIPFGADGETPKTQIIPNWLSKLWGKHDLPYANFGVTLREIGSKVGWWGDQLYHYGGDVRLSIEVWLAGFTVVPLDQGSLVHYAVDDGTRVPNVETQILMQIYHPQRAWQFETQTTRRRNEQKAAEEARKLDEQGRERHAERRQKKLRPDPPTTPIQLRYKGKQVNWATYTDTPSGRTYRFRLRAHATVIIDSSDLAWFMQKTEDSTPAFEVIG